MGEKKNYNSDKSKIIAEDIWSEEIPAVIEGKTTLVSGLNNIFQCLFNRVKAINILPFFKWNFGFDLNKVDRNRELDKERDLDRNTLTEDIITEIETNRSYARTYGNGLEDKNREISIKVKDESILVEKEGISINKTDLLTVSSSGVLSSSVAVKGINDKIESHRSRRDNPHGVTKGQVGLGKVNNWEATSSIADASDTKFATASAVKKAFDKGTWALEVANKKAEKNGNKDEDFNVNNLYIKNRKFLDFPSNSIERGPFNPIAAMLLKVGKQLYPDVDFKNGMNSIHVYNNLVNGVVTIGRLLGTDIEPKFTPPNSSGYVLRIKHNGGNSMPGYGGFYQPIPSKKNKTYVQIFQALVPKGLTLQLAENSQGSHNTSYWLTNTIGTGKWEWYVRVSHCGDSGEFNTGGHIYADSTVGSQTWYLASSTVVDATAF